MFEKIIPRHFYSKHLSYKKPISGHWGVSRSHCSWTSSSSEVYRVPSENSNATHVGDFSDYQKNPSEPSHTGTEGNTRDDKNLLLRGSVPGVSYNETAVHSPQAADLLC